MNPDPCSGERERADDGRKKYLPRLDPGYYRGLTFIHWTLTTEDRARGWITPEFKQVWELTLLHSCARYGLVAPVFVLMPDHIHLLWLGTRDTSDQGVGMEFLRKHTAGALRPATWQKQAHDHVLRENEREKGTFLSVAHYLLQNPVRAGICATWQEYPHTGCCVPGYPDLLISSPDYWDLFWRIYHRMVERSSARSRSPLH